MRKPRYYDDVQLRALLEQIPDAVLVADEEGTVVFANSRIEDVLGYTPEELCDQPIEILVPEPNRADHGSLRRSFMGAPTVRRMGEGRILQARHREGHDVPVEISLGPIQSTGGLLVSTVVRDATESYRRQRKLEEMVTAKTDDLRRALDRQERVAALGRTALCSVRLHSLMKEALDCLRSALGVDCVEVLELRRDARELVMRYGLGWSDGVVGRATLSAGPGSHAGLALDSNDPVIFHDLAGEGRFPRSSVLHDHDIVSGVAVVVDGPEGRFGVLGAHAKTPIDLSPNDASFVQEIANVLGDALARNELESRLRRRSTLTSLGEMAASIVHDIKNPLAGIAGAVEVLREQSEDDHASLPVFSMILERLKTLQRSLDEALSYAWTGRQSVEPVALRALAAGAVDAVRNDPACARIDVSVSGQEVIAPGDAVQLEATFLNLLVNAMQAIEGEGRVVVKVEARMGHGRISVRDSGPGIPREIMSKVFDPFFSTKKGGSGLGLANARRIVEAHGGRIRISCRGRGTLVSVFLPLAPRLDDAPPR